MIDVAKIVECALKHPTNLGTSWRESMEAAAREAVVLALEDAATQEEEQEDNYAGAARLCLLADRYRQEPKETSHD